MDQLLAASLLQEIEQCGGGNKRHFPLEKPADPIILHVRKIRIGQMIRTKQANVVFPFHQRSLANQTEAGVEQVQEIIQNHPHNHSR